VNVGNGYIYIGCCFAFITGFAIGIGPLFWVYIYDLFPKEVRDEGTAVIVSANWVGSFVLSFTFSYVNKSIAIPFFCFAAIGLFCIVYGAFNFPDSKQYSENDSPKSFWSCFNFKSYDTSIWTI